MSFQINSPKEQSYPKDTAIAINGIWNGGLPNRMWFLVESGQCPGLIRNPFEVNATAFAAQPNQTWSAPNVTLTIAGQYCLTVWCIQPGDNTIQDKQVKFTVT